MHIKKIAKRPVAALLGLMVAIAAMPPAPANASVITFDSFGAGNSFDTDFLFGVDGSSAFQAFQFTAASSGTLAAITVAIGRTGSGTINTQFDLFADNSNALGALLESSLVPNTVPVDSTDPFTAGLISFSSVVQPMLTAGQNYWLSITEPNAIDGSNSLWFNNDQGLLGPRITPVQSGIASMPAFRVEVTQVLEPGTLALFGFGLAGLGFARRKRAA